MSRTRGGRKRSRRRAAAGFGSTVFSSAGVSRTAWPGSRTQAPSSAMSRARASVCSMARKAGAGSRGSSRAAAAAHARCRQGPDCRDGSVASVATSARLSRSQVAGERPSVVPDDASITASSARRHRVDLGAGERAIARKAHQGRHSQAARSSSAASAAAGSSIACASSCAQPLGRAALARRRAQIEETAAADGALRRGVAQHEAVAAPRPRSAAPARVGRAPRRRARSASSPSSTTRAAISLAA